MSKDIIIFGKSSILAKNFDKNIDKTTNNLIYITRKPTSLKDIACNIGSNLTRKELDQISIKIKKISRNQKKIFILFSWSGSPRKFNEENDITNKNIVKNFLELSKRIRVRKLIFISSAGSIYPESKDYKFREYDQISPQNTYGEQKIRGEIAIEEFSKNEGTKFNILRVSSAFGFDPRFSDQGVINKWLYYAINKKTLQLYNSPDSLVNFISFNQVSAALKASIDLDLEGIYNIGTEKSISLQEILNQISIVVNEKVEYQILEKNKRYFNIDTNKFYKHTGIIFQIDLAKNISYLYEAINNKYLNREMY